MTGNRVLLILGISVVVILIFGGIVLAVVYLLNISFQPGSAPAPTVDANMINTMVAQTIEAQLTAQTPLPTAAPSSTLEPSVTEAPTSTVTQTQVPIQPTNTVPSPTMLVPTFTAVPSVCNQAQFIRDLSVQDNSLLEPGASFTKSWRLKNVGNCTWLTNYSLVFQSGDAMEAKQSIPIPRNVEPNQTIDLSVPMKAPKNEGTYRGDWKLSDQYGNRFGIGSSGNQTFWVQIKVKNLADPDLALDFAANYCRAEWSSAAGRLFCPGTSSGDQGFVILLQDPNLENRQENELALWTQPNRSGNGWISGMYPEFTIQPNQHFRAWVGCLAESKGCNVLFRLDFKNTQNGNIRNLGSWHEIYEGEVTKIDLDLSPHAGKRVRFILTVEIFGGDPSKANAFWFVPGIANVPAPIATLVPSATPTPTPTQTETPPPSATPTETVTP